MTFYKTLICMLLILLVTVFFMLAVLYAFGSVYGGRIAVILSIISTIILIEISDSYFSGSVLV